MGEGSSQNTSGTSSLDYSFDLTGDSQSASGTRSLAYMGRITGDCQSTSGTGSLAHVGSIIGDSQGTSSTSGPNTNLGIGNNISNTMGMSSTNNRGLGSNISNMIGMSSTNNLGLGSNISNTMDSSSSSNLGLGSNMNNLAVSLGLAGDGQGASKTRSLAFNDSLGSNMSHMPGSSMLGISTNAVDSLGNIGASSMKYSKGSDSSSYSNANENGNSIRGETEGLKRDLFTARGYNGFSPWSDPRHSKSQLQIYVGQSALGLMDTLNLGVFNNFTINEFYFDQNRDQRYHLEKQPQFLDEVASAVFPSSNAANWAHLDRLKTPLFSGPLHQEL